MIALWLMVQAALVQAALAQDTLAQDTLAQGTPWDLATATERALTVGVDLEVCALAVADREATLRGRRGAALPDLQLRASTSGSLGRTWSETVGANITQPVGSAGVGLYSSMPIYEGGQVRANRQQAEAWLEAARRDQAQARHDIAWAVADGLLAVDEARAQVEIRRAALSSAEALLARIQAYVDNGARTLADLHQQQANVAQARATLASAEQGLGDSRLGLARLLRLDPSEPADFLAPTAAPTVSEDPTTLVQQALERRPGLAGLAAQVEATQAGRRSARGGRLPQLGLSAGTSTSLITSNDAAVTEQLGDQASAWVSLDLTVPLLDRNATAASVDAAVAGERSAALGLADEREEVAVHIHQVLLGLRTARETERAAEEALVAATAAQAVVEDRYAAGLASLVELTSAREAVVSARAEGAVARTDVLRAGFTLAWATGALAP